MGNFFARQHRGYINELSQSIASLVGMAGGMLSDGHLSDGEIAFLDEWLDRHSAIATTWPGDVLHERIKAARVDGVITESERKHLVEVLLSIHGGRIDALATSPAVASLALDEDVSRIVFEGRVFCLTGDFVYAPRAVCTREIESRGGAVKSAVSRKLDYLVIGGLGSSEWKHGSFGTKVEAAMGLKQAGAKLAVVHEDVWARSLHG